MPFNVNNIIKAQNISLNLLNIICKIFYNIICIKEQATKAKQ